MSILPNNKIHTIVYALQQLLLPQHHHLLGFLVVVSVKTGVYNHFFFYFDIVNVFDVERICCCCSRLKVV